MTGVSRAHVVLIARTELQRRWRSIRDDTARMLAFAFVALLLLPFSVAGVFGAYLLGGIAAESGSGAVLDGAGMAAVYAWIFVVGFGGYRAYAVALRPDNVDGLLTTVSHREVIGGLALAELLVWTAFVLTAGVAAAVAFGIGARSLLTVPFVAATLVCVLTTGLLGGFLLALAVRNTGVRSVLLTRLRTLLFLLLGVAYFWVAFTGAFVSVLDPLYRVFAPTPLGWFGDLAVLGLDAGPSPLRAVGAVAFAGGFVVVAVPAMHRLAAWLWYADGVHIDHSVEREAETRGSSRLSGLLPAPVLGVVTADWKRARRSPLSLSFALYPLIVLAGPITTAVQTGSIGTGLPLWLLLCGAWIAGSLFALNVLGHEGAVLPSTLLAADGGRSLVVGHVIAGALLVAPLTVAATVATGVASPHSLPVVASLALSAVVLSVATGTIATGIGVAFPRFEAVSVSRSTKAVVPSTIAFAVYSVVVAVVSLPTLLAHSGFVGGTLAEWFGVSRLAIGVVGTGTAAVVAVGVGLVSAYVALDRLDGYRMG